MTFSTDQEKIVLISDEEIDGDPSPQSDPIQAAPQTNVNAPGTSGKQPKGPKAKKAAKGSAAGSGASAAPSSPASGSTATPNVSGKSPAKKGTGGRKSAKGKPTAAPGQTAEARLARMRQYAALRASGKTQVQAAAMLGLVAQTACDYEQDPAWQDVYFAAVQAFVKETVLDYLGPIVHGTLDSIQELLKSNNQAVRASAIKTATDQLAPWIAGLGIDIRGDAAKRAAEQNQGRTLSVDGLTNDEVSVLLKAMLGQGQASQQAPGRGIVSGPSVSVPTTSTTSTGPAGARN